MSEAHVPRPAAVRGFPIDNAPEGMVTVQPESKQPARHDEFELAECVPRNRNNSRHGVVMSSRRESSSLSVESEGESAADGGEHRSLACSRCARARWEVNKTVHDVVRAGH